MTTLGSKPFSIDSVDDYRRIRAVFEDAGYTDRTIVDTLEVGRIRSPGPKHLPQLLHRTDGGRSVDTLIRLFLLGVEVPEAEVAAAISPLNVDDGLRYGLLRRSGDDIRAAVQIRYYQGMLVAFDWAGHDDTIAQDFVMGISSSSITLAGATVRRPVGAALDLGTGSGFQALLAAHHSARVVATDLNPRAVSMATFNAGLNNIEIDGRQGDLFSPVAGEAFDLIVSNAPFVVAPDRTHFFLHGGALLDGVCRTIATSAPRHLNDGGICQFLANWVVRNGQDPDDAVAEWFEGTGCDAWVMVTHRYDPGEYAAAWIEVASVRYAAEYDRWMHFFADHGVIGIGFGLITMRTSAARDAWVAVEEAPDSYAFPSGDDVVALLDARDLMTLLDDRALLASVLVIDPGVRLDVESAPSGTAWHAQRHRIRRTTGLKYQGPIDPAGADLVRAFDGTKPVGAVVDAWLTDHDLDSSLIPAVCENLRSMVRRGFLRLVSG